MKQGYRVIALALGSTVLAAADCNEEAAKDWRASFLAAASRLEFSKPDSAVTDHQLPSYSYPAGAPRMTLAWTKPAGPSGAVVARISSSGAYPRLGIAPGDNYIWISVRTSPGRPLLIPADSTRPVVYWVMAADSHRSEGVPMRLRVVRDNAGSGGGENEGSAPGTRPVPAESLRVDWCHKCTAAEIAAAESLRKALRRPSDSTDQSEPESQPIFADSASRWCSTKASLKLPAGRDVPVEEMRKFFEGQRIEWPRPSRTRRGTQP